MQSSERSPDSRVRSLAYSRPLCPQRPTSQVHEVMKMWPPLSESTEYILFNITFTDNLRTSPPPPHPTELTTPLNLTVILFPLEELYLPRVLFNPEQPHS